MTFKEKFYLTESWKERAIITELFHLMMQAKPELHPEKPRWGLRDTAKYFDISLGMCSENLKIASVAEHLGECRFRKDAMNMIHHSNKDNKE